MGFISRQQRFPIEANGVLNWSYLNTKPLLDFLQVIAGSSPAHFHKDATVCFPEGPVPTADTPQFTEKDPGGLWIAHGHLLNVIFPAVSIGQLYCPLGFPSKSRLSERMENLVLGVQSSCFHFCESLCASGIKEGLAGVEPAPQFPGWKVLEAMEQLLPGTHVCSTAALTNLWGTQEVVWPSQVSYRSWWTSSERAQDGALPVGSVPSSKHLCHVLSTLRVRTSSVDVQDKGRHP